MDWHLKTMPHLAAKAGVTFGVSIDDLEGLPLRFWEMDGNRTDLIRIIQNSKKNLFNLPINQVDLIKAAGHQYDTSEYKKGFKERQGDQKEVMEEITGPEKTQTYTRDDVLVAVERVCEYLGTRAGSDCCVNIDNKGTGTCACVFQLLDRSTAIGEGKVRMALCVRQIKLLPGLIRLPI